MPFYFYILIAVAVVVVVSIGIGMLRWTQGDNKKRAEREQVLEVIRASGNRGTAKILRTEYIGLDPISNRRSAFVMELEVTPESGGSPYVIDKDLTSRIPMFFCIDTPFADRLKKVGAELPVLIHPDDPMKVILDEAKIEQNE